VSEDVKRPSVRGVKRPMKGKVASISSKQKKRQRKALTGISALAEEESIVDDSFEWSESAQGHERLRSATRDFIEGK
jgi:hypothetical protein